VAQIVQDEQQFTIYTWHHPERVSVTHAGIIKKVPACGRPQGPLPLPLSAVVRILPTPRPRLCGRPLWTAPKAVNELVNIHNSGPESFNTQHGQSL